MSLHSPPWLSVKALDHQVAAAYQIHQVAQPIITDKIKLQAETMVLTNLILQHCLNLLTQTEACHSSIQ